MTRTRPNCGSGSVRHVEDCETCLCCAWSACVATDGGTEETPLWRRDEGRYAERRAEYLERTADLTEKKGRVLAYSELGYSSSGIAKRVDLAEATVKKHLEQLEVRFGPRTVCGRRPTEIDIVAEIGPVQLDDLLTLPDETVLDWKRLAKKYPAETPPWFGEEVAEWVGKG